MGSWIAANPWLSGIIASGVLSALGYAIRRLSDPVYLATAVAVLHGRKDRRDDAHRTVECLLQARARRRELRGRQRGS